MIRSAIVSFRRAATRGSANLIARLAKPLEKRHLLYWPFLSEAISMVPFAFGWQLRRELYQILGGGCGEGTILHHGVTVEDRRTSFGIDVWVASKAYIDYAQIGDHVLIGPQAVLLSGRHHHRTDRTDVPIKHQGNHEKKPIQIGIGAWIGANATVMANVGSHAVVGAGAVVVAPVPDFGIAVGNPARIIGDRRHSRARDATGNT